jgi:hypothetical protein
MTGLFEHLRCAPCQVRRNPSSGAQRKPEFGIRMAPGATETDVKLPIVGLGLGQALFGMVAGTRAAWALTGLMSSFSFEMSPADPVRFARRRVAVGPLRPAAFQGVAQPTSIPRWRCDMSEERQ